jgi:hypothetical protein
MFFQHNGQAAALHGRNTNVRHSASTVHVQQQINTSLGSTFQVEKANLTPTTCLGVAGLRQCMPHTGWFYMIRDELLTMQSGIKTAAPNSSQNVQLRAQHRLDVLRCCEAHVVFEKQTVNREALSVCCSTRCNQ